jgi:hypothetical protein
MTYHNEEATAVSTQATIKNIKADPKKTVLSVFIYSSRVHPNGYDGAFSVADPGCRIQKQQQKRGVKKS